MNSYFPDAKRAAVKRQPLLLSGLFLGIILGVR